MSVYEVIKVPRDVICLLVAFCQGAMEAVTCIRELVLDDPSSRSPILCAKKKKKKAIKAF